MDIKLINLERQHKKIQNEVFREYKQIFSKSSFIMGENVKEFEKELAQYLNVKHVISVGNGTDALVIALKALGIKPGDEVITTAYSFFASCECISAVGATPVFVDVNQKTYDIDVKQLEKKITSKTKAIIPVHLFGNPAKMDKIMEIAKKHNLYVVEDACQAIGGSYAGNKCGSIGDIGCFSFFPTKNLGGVGDGGAITTNSDSIATICRGLRTHGGGSEGKKAFELLNNIESTDEKPSEELNSLYNPFKYFNYLIGYNSRLDELQAAVLRIKLRHLDKYTRNRLSIINKYNKAFKNTKLILPTATYNSKHVYHLYILQSEHREELTNYLKEKGIATGIYYQIPLHLQKAMEYLKYKEGDCPTSEYLSQRTFAIPLYPYMTKEETNYVIETILEWENKNDK